MKVKNACDWPTNSPVWVRKVRAPMAAPVVSVGRMIEQTGNLRSRKICGFGHDQVGLEVFGVEGWAVQVGEDEPVGGVGERRRVAGFVLPGLEVHRFRRADAEQDAQHFRFRDALGE